MITAQHYINPAWDQFGKFHVNFTFFPLRYTLQEKSKHVYAIILDWPSESTIQLGAPVTNQDTTVTMLGLDMKFSWKPVPGKSGIVITVPPIHQLPCKWAWVFRLENVKWKWKWERPERNEERKEERIKERKEVRKEQRKNGREEKETEAQPLGKVTKKVLRPQCLYCTSNQSKWCLLGPFYMSQNCWN